MKRHKQSVEEALDFIRRKHQVAWFVESPAYWVEFSDLISLSPNEGFITQLSVYQRMQYVVDVASPIYRTLDFHSTYGFSKRNGSEYALSTVPMIDSSLGKDRDFRCRMCRFVGRRLKSSLVCNCSFRQTLCSSSKLLLHDVGTKKTLFTNERKELRDKTSSGNPDEPCSSFFFEPLEWVESSLQKNSLDGKVCCIGSRRIDCFNRTSRSCVPNVAPKLDLITGQVRYYVPYCL